MNVTPKAFAARVGKTESAILKAISSGRIARAVTRSGRRIFIDLDIGQQEFLGAHYEPPTEPVRGPVRAAPVVSLTTQPDDVPPLEESLAVEKYWKAKQAELIYRKASGELVESSIVAVRYADEVTACRSKLLGIVSRIRQRMSLKEEQFQLIEGLIREGLEELGRERGDDSDQE